MRANRVYSLYLATLFASALATGCHSSEPPDEALCDDGSCFTRYACHASLWDFEYTPILLCDGTDITTLGPDSFRETCQLTQEAADAFCRDECVKAALANDFTQAQADESCQGGYGLPLFDEGNYTECYYDRHEINKPLDYSPAAVCGGGGGGGCGCDSGGEADMSHVYCVGTAEPSAPPGHAFDFNEAQVSFWKETLEGDVWHPTATSLPLETACGYKAYHIMYEGLNLSDDEMCVRECYAKIDEHDGATVAMEGYEDAVRVERHNCDSFVAVSQCNGPVSPALVGPFTAPLTLAATLDAGGGQASTTFAGQISYSTYACAAGAASCPIVIHDLALEMTRPVRGHWVTSAGATSFFSSDLAVLLERPTSGLFSSSTGSFLLPQASVPVHVRGQLLLGSVAAPQEVDVHAHNARDFSGSVASDGSIDVAGAFELAPGKTVYFGAPGPQ